MKFACAYIEEEVLGDIRVQKILKKIPDIPRITIERFGEVFNRKSQNFRLQKSNPALILAKKYGNLVLPAPPGYGFDNKPSFYFSHMLNCVYDCRYCFLQGMYRSANYVLFTNYEEYCESIAAELANHPNGAVFYSGYDCDSLALEPVSEFASYFLQWFRQHPEATLEIRTKSTQVRKLLDLEPVKNCVIAMSFTPQDIHQKWEEKVPHIKKRLEALCKLQQQGWSIALRLEPLIYQHDFEKSYRNLLIELFNQLEAENMHSVSMGLFRMPKSYFKNIIALYPDEPLYARRFEQRDGQVSQFIDQEAEMMNSLECILSEYVPKSVMYRCG